MSCVRGVGCGVQDVGCEVWVWGAGFGVRGVGCRMWGAGCGVRGVSVAHVCRLLHWYLHTCRDSSPTVLYTNACTCRYSTVSCESNLSY